MSLKLLYKAQDMYARLRELDAEIISVEKLAEEYKDEREPIKISFDQRPLKSTEDSNEEYGPSPLGGLFFPAFSFSTGLASMESQSSKTSFKVSEVAALQMLGVLIAHLNAERLTIRAELKRISAALEIV